MHLLNVTDGLMVQVTMEAMADLRRSLRAMKDFTVTCGKLPPAERQEYVHIQWQDEEPRFNKGLETNIYTVSLKLCWFPLILSCISQHHQPH